MVSIDRLEGFKSALRDVGLPIDPNLIEESEFSEDGGYEAAKRLLPRNPDAIFSASDSIASGVLRACHEAGVRVPEDVSVIGYDDMPFAATTVPPLTTVRQPVAMMGATAVETLIDIIEQPNSQARRIILPTEFVVRNSCQSINDK